MTKRKQHSFMAFIEANPDLPNTVELWPSSWPFLQWSNPHKAFEAPSNHFAGSVLEAAAPQGVQMIEHDMGRTQEPATLHDMLHLCVIAPRTVWQRGEGDDVHYSLTYAEGYKSRTHVLCLVREAESLTPVILTLGGYTADRFIQSYKAYRTKFATLTAKATGGQALPDYLFYCPFAASDEAVYVGSKEKAAIYPPTCHVQ